MVRVAVATKPEPTGCPDLKEKWTPKLKYSLGVSIAVRKYPVTSRTWKSSSLAAKVVPGELGVRIARCTLHFIKSPLTWAFFFGGSMIALFKKMALRLLILLPLYTILRLTFYLSQNETYAVFDDSSIFESFILGLRFDLAVLLIINSLIIFIPHKKIQSFIFAFLNFLGIAFSLFDNELFSINGKRLSKDFFLISHDIILQLPQLTINYWYLPFISFLIFIFLYKIDQRFTVEIKKKDLLFTPLYLALCFIGVRGGLQRKSITIQSAFIQGDNRLGHLVLNTPYHFLRGLHLKEEKDWRFFSSMAEAQKVIPSPMRNSSPLLKKNIVLIIMESFSLDSLESGHMPWLKAHLSSSKHLSNGKRSIEALPSLLCGLPSLLQNPITKSSYQSNQFICLTDVLKKNGYQNLFFHGGKKGTMGFDAFTLSHGVSQYYAYEDDTNPSHYDGTWGIYDHYFFDFMTKSLSTQQTPFFAGFFSLSSHQPYSIPEELKTKFKKGTLEIHQSIEYADWALGEFMNQNKHQEWFKNSIIIITADHTQKIELEKFNNFIGQYRVPLSVIIDGEVLKIEKATQHSDIPNVVLEKIGLKEQVGFGRRLEDNEEAVLNFSDGQQYYYLHQNFVETISIEGIESFYRYNWDTGELIKDSQRDNKKLKAYLHVYFQSLRENIVTPYP